MSNDLQILWELFWQNFSLEIRLTLVFLITVALFVNSKRDVFNKLLIRIGWSSWSTKRKALLAVIFALVFISCSYLLISTLLSSRAESKENKNIEKQQDESQILNNIQKQNVNATNQSTAIGVNVNSGNQTFISQMVEKSEPALSMNVEVLSDNPFDADFLISNGGLTDAENVKVKILFFDYLVGADDKCKLYLTLGNLSESDKILRNIPEIKAGANKVNTKIRDLVVYDSNGILGFSGCGTRTILSPTVLSDDVVNILDIPPELKDFFKSSLICFDVSYEWKDQNIMKTDTERLGFIIDKDKFGNSWLARSNICTSEYVQSRVNDMREIAERDRFR